MNMRLRSRREDGRLRLAVLAACDVGVRYLFVPGSIGRKRLIRKQQNNVISKSTKLAGAKNISESK